MRLLIYILALTSAFFVSAEPDMDDLRSPKVEPMTTYQCINTNYPRVESIDECFAIYKGISSVQSLDGCETIFEVNPVHSNPTQLSLVIRKQRNTTTKPVYCTIYSSFSYRLTITDEQITETKSCPPNGMPLHKIDVVDSLGQHMCAKPLEDKDCPAGYHSKAVSKAMGSDSCMPKECPAAGSGEDLYSSKMTGGVPFNGGGMYCNDGCAYSVKSENVTSDQYALGTSQGAACGDKPYDNKKLSDEGDEGQCETNTVDGVTIIFCNNEPAPPTDKDDDANNDGSKEDETEKPKKDLEDCASDDNACMLRNLIKEQSNNTQVQIENDNKLHNKMVDTATNNTNILKTAIDDLHTTVFVGLQKNDKLEAVKASKMNDLISAVREGNQILTDKPIGGGGGGGGGNGGGDGDGEGGGDCEGGAADCVPIVGSEIPKEVVNLSQYADKYDDWLPNAELPEEKCIVLTTGQSLCFSFSAFIILFQAISGLIVISSLLHSARIIAGAI